MRLEFTRSKQLTSTNERELVKCILKALGGTVGQAVLEM